MAFKVEDGTGYEDSNSYLSIADFKAYWTDRGVTFTESDAVIQSWLILASEFADMNSLFVGDRKSAAQAMEWPRVNAEAKTGKLYTSSDIPEFLERGVSELAYIIKSRGTLEPNVTDNAGIAAKSIGPVKITFTSGGAYGTGAYAEPLYRKAAKWLSYITTPNQLTVLRV